MSVFWSLWQTADKRSIEVEWQINDVQISGVNVVHLLLHTGKYNSDTEHFYCTKRCFYSFPTQGRFVVMYPEKEQLNDVLFHNIIFT